MCLFLYTYPFRSHEKLSFGRSCEQEKPKETRSSALMRPQDLVQRNRKSLSWGEEVRCYRASDWPGCGSGGRAECVGSSQTGWCIHRIPVVIQPGQESVLGWWAFAGLLFVKLFQGLNQKLFLATWTNVLEEVRIHCPIRWIAGCRVQEGPLSC